MEIGPFFADFLCRELKLVVEIDGFSHDLRSGYDKARDRWLVDEGYRVLRFTNADVLTNASRARFARRCGTRARPWPTPNPSRKREGDEISLAEPRLPLD